MATRRPSVVLVAGLLLATASSTAPVDFPGRPELDCGGDPGCFLPPARSVVWKPGLNAVGGIPERTKECARIDPSGADDTPVIQAALDRCPAKQVVQLGEGTFRITGEGLVIGRSGVVLRGRGPERTMLVKSPGSNFPVVIIGRRWFKFTQPVDLAASAAKGQTHVELVRDPGLKVGELVILDQLTNPSLTVWGPNSPPGAPSRGWFSRPDRPIGQVLEIGSISGSRVEFTTPLHLDYPATFRPQLFRISADPDGTPIDAVKYSGIEDLRVSGGEGGDGGGNIHLFATAYCWVKNVESDASIGTGVALQATFRCVVRDSYIHSTRDPNPGGGGYGVGLNVHAADNLIENNIIWSFNKVVVCRASGGGNVFGYNYAEDGYGAGYPTIVEVGLNASHYASPHMELFEGNQAFNFDSDAFWGNSIFVTVFRNHFTARRRSIPPLKLVDVMNRRAVGLSHHTWWFSFLGNALGEPGQALISRDQRSFVYEMNENFGDWSRVPMWKLGYDGQKWSPPQDPTVPATTIRHGNYDYVTKRVAWDPRIPGRRLPPSLYLESKPAFFGKALWPFVDPERNPVVGVLPARKRFDEMRRTP